MSGATRYLAHQFGHWAETLCVWWLRLRAYRVLAWDTLAFVEVKARHEGSKDDTGEVLTTHQRSRITRAAEAFVARHSGLGDCAMRFDLMAVRPWQPPHHLADAWRLPRCHRKSLCRTFYRPILDLNRLGLSPALRRIAAITSIRALTVRMISFKPEEP